MAVLFKSTNMAQIKRIAERADVLMKKSGKPFDRRRTVMDTVMDLDACNSNGCPLDFDKLEKFDDFNLMHDVLGIARHIDRKTGKLNDHFWPRCAKPRA